MLRNAFCFTARIFRRCLLVVASLMICTLVAAQTCGVPGLSGPAPASGIVNSYHAGNGTAAAGASLVTVASVAGQRSATRSLAAGDLVLIIQMQDGTTPGNAGRHEYATINSIAGTVLTLNRSLTNTYVQNVTANLVRTFQVVYVPQYSSAAITGAITADRWSINNTGFPGAGTGGIVAMDVAGNLALTGNIDVSGAGFRGGAAFNSTSSRAGGAFSDLDYVYNLAAANGSVKGEGTAGSPILVFDGTATPVNYSTLYGQGYALGSGGVAARGNAGGGGNDGEPNGGGNQYNSGGGGGSNGGAGGQGGRSWSFQNDAGGRGATAPASSITQIVLGGGGGAGSTNNNGVANAITTWPPIVNATTRATPPAAGVVNGAQGAISVSGAPGGGMVLLRAGSMTGAGSIDANGYTAFNTYGGSEGAGGGGAGGSVVVLAGNATSGALLINANGGGGGYSNYFDHGPGGGGGGGVVITNFTGATISSAAGPNGNDGCCAANGTAANQGNASPKADSAAPGGIGSSSTAGGTPAGVLAGASCLPALQVSKTALQPLISAATGATTSYAINVSNTRGAATNVFLLDANLPPGWTYAAAPVTTYSYTPVPPGAGAAGAETTPATLPAGLPVNTAATANSGAAISLRGNGAAPGAVPSTGSNSPTFGSFYLPQNGSITVTFAITIPDAATVGTYHNPAGVLFLDPTRAAADGLRMVSPLAGVSDNRTTTAYSSNTAYSNAPAGNVLGANYSGLPGGPTGENVTLLADFSVSKTASTTTFTIGKSGLSYTIVGRNNGRAVADQVFASTQASSQSATAIASISPTVTDTLPPGMTLTAITNSTPGVWTCTPNATSTTFACAASAAVYPMPAASDIVNITATVSVSNSTCPGPRTNTAVITTPAIGDSLPANNSAVAVTSIGCATTLTVAKTDGTTFVSAGSTTAYTVTYSNLGPAAADGSVVSDSPGVGLSCTSVTCSAITGGATCPAGLSLGVPTAAGSTTFFGGGSTIALMPAASTIVLTVSCGVTATGQ